MNKSIFAALVIIVLFLTQTTDASPTFRLDNGHVYDIVYLGGSSNPYPSAVSLASTRNAHLVTITTSAEQSWIASRLSGIISGGNSAWTGGTQNRTSPSYSEPYGGWEWVTGEPWTFTNNSFADNYGGYQDNLILHPTFMWDDTSLGEYTGSRQFAALEWDSLDSYHAYYSNDPLVDTYAGAPAAKSYIAFAGNTFGYDWDLTDINTLYTLFTAGENNQEWDPVIVDGAVWRYSDTTYAGHSAGDRWTENGIDYIYLGTAGLEGGFIPEPASIILIGITCALMIFKSRNKILRK
ncbi:MAG: hypothetical protein AB1454_11425 [Candidatus Auribacterota bacterium]